MDEAGVEQGTTPRPPADNDLNGPEATDDPSAAANAPSRRTAVLRSGFVVILPRFIDYEEVVAVFRSLTLPQLLVMTTLAGVAWIVSGLLFTTLVRGLSPLRGAASYLILGGIGASVPLGPWNMGVLWVVIRGWGVPIQPATTGIALYGVINVLGRLAVPLLAALAILLSGERYGDSGVARLVALISTVVYIAATVLMVAVVRSDHAGHRIAGIGQRATSWVLEHARRPERPDITGAVRRFHDGFGGLLERRGLAAMLVSLLGQLTWCGLLIAALRVVGVPAETLAPVDVLVVFALVGAVTVIPIAPGGAGVPELLYIAGLSAIAGPQYESVIAAGVMLFRLYQWFLPIPIAWILLKVTRRGRSMLPTTAELRGFARESPA